MKELSGTALLDLLPEVLKADEGMTQAGEALSSQLASLLGLTETPAIFLRSQELTGRQLDHFAQLVDPPAWDRGWSDAVKRSMLLAAIQTKRTTGTLYAVKQVLASLGAAVTVTEWWETNPKGTPHTFKVTAVLGEVNGLLSASQQEAFVTALDRAKPVRSHYEFIISFSFSGGISAAAAMRSLTLFRLSNF